MKLLTHHSPRTPVSCDSLAEWEKVKEKLRKQIEFSSQINLLKHDAPLDPHFYPADEYEDFVIETVVFQTLPGFWLAGNIYRPKDTTKKYPVILNPHGHWTKGRIDMQPRGMLPVRFANFAMRGFVVFVYDMIGFNDTNQIGHEDFLPEFEEYNYGPFALQLNNSIKALDFVQTLPYVDPEKIGCTGCSGGGTQTYFLAAMDERVKAAAPINMSSAFMQGGCGCENTAFLRTDYCNVDYTAMCAPRPMFMAASTGDWTSLSETVEFPAIRKIYSLYNAEDKFETFFREADHCYEQCTRERAYDFFCRVFDVPNKFDSEVEIEVDTSKVVIGGIPDFEGKIKSKEELFEVAKGIMEENLKKLTPEEKEEIKEMVFAFDKDFYFDIPYAIIDRWGTLKVVLGDCPPTFDTLIDKTTEIHHHTYNYADDTKRVNCLVKLMKQYPNGVFIATKKTAALCEIAQKYAPEVRKWLSQVDYTGIHIPGIKLIKD